MISSNSNNEEKCNIISNYFDKVSSIIRNSSPPPSSSTTTVDYSPSPPISDTIRLQLYGYYKCATASSLSEDQLEGKQPSIFNPVGRAKYNAILSAKSECCGNKYMAMIRYVEVAASQAHINNEVGKQCEVMYRQMKMELTSSRRSDSDGKIDAQQNDNLCATQELQKEEYGNNSAEQKQEITTQQCSIDISKTKHHKVVQSYPKQITSFLQSSILQKSLFPRGQLDISILALFYALYQCTTHILYTCFIGTSGILQRILALMLPRFILTLINIGLGKYHPRQREVWYEEKIRQYWLRIMKNAISNDDGDQQHEQQQQHECSNKQQSNDVVVGLSIRSLLDLYLTTQSYPTGSEIIIVPPVTIPGMVDVMEYHGLKLVPVDLLQVANAAGNTSNDVGAKQHQTKSKNNLYTFASWGIDTTAIKASITPRTVSIFIIHPFGTIIANSKTMKEVRCIANEHDVEVWEDCAQCYTGHSSEKTEVEEKTVQQLGYAGSKYANISFFSFGPIKTGTALGGGIALLRDTVNNNESCVEETAKSMRRIQDTIYKPQTNISYLIRVIKCLVIHCTSQSRLLCGLIKAILERIGLNYDVFVVTLLRGFAVEASDNDQRRKELIQQIRRRPCMALLALLHRRLLDSDRTHQNAVQRMKRCHAFSTLLLSNKQISDHVTLPRNIDGSNGMYGWIFPVLVPNAQRTSELLLEMGYDAPCGMTQLKPIEIDKEDGGDGCPRARAVFDHTVYLPVTSYNFSKNDQIKLIHALAKISSSSMSSDEETINRNELALKRKQPLILRRKYLFFCIGLIEWYFSIFGIFYCIPFQIILRLIVLIGPFIGAFIAITLISLLVLSHYMGPIYLKSTNTFAKYCCMIFKSPFDRPKSDDEDKFIQSATVLELDSTKIPVSVPSGDALPSSNDAQQVLLTGATGFIGSLLLRELLLHRHSLSISGGVIVIVRSKRGKSARERIDRLLSQSMFDFLSESERQSLVHVMEGNVAWPDCGMPSDEIKSLCERNISHVFHCAAAVSFSQPFEDAAASNITSSLQLQRLAEKLRRKDVKFVYFSTAFVHGGKTGTHTKPLPEEVFSLHPYDPVELYKSMTGSQSYASAAMHELGFPNTYTFSKCICEHLLRTNKEVETIIIRPSIVGPSVQEPYEGWAGEKPSTIVAAACLYLKFPYNMWCFGQDKVPFVPVDIVCRFVISKVFSNGGVIGHSDDVYAYNESEDEKKETSPLDICAEKRSRSTIATVAWDASSPASSSFSWVSYAFAITHLGVVCGHVKRIVAYVGLLLSTRLFPWLNLRADTFQHLHSILVRAPLDIILDICEQLPMKPRILHDLRALSPLIDLPMLFFPFANQSFYFQSNLVAPQDFNGERYMFSCAVAAHRFIRIIEQQRRQKKKIRSRHVHDSNIREYGNSTSIVIAGATHTKPVSDLWWSLTQPKGNLTIRFAGWILSKIFRHTSMEIEIDTASFEALSRVLSSSSSKSATPHVILAPTHRSFYDFLIVSYICFSLPELGLDIPYIAAASNFSSIPIVGWLAKQSHAFFLKRDSKTKDHHLKESLDSIITRSKKDPAFIEVFIEGKRSRGRTFVSPKTGFLRCLAATESEYIILPLAINYEGIPDEAALIEEVTNHGHGEKMSLTKLMHWMCRAFTGHVNIGRVYVSASETLAITNTSGGQDILKLAHAIQSRQQSRVMISNYHIRAASRAFDLSEDVVKEALTELGCQFWPTGSQNMYIPPLQDNQDMLWAAMLQFGHLFGPLLRTSHPMWSSWLSPSDNHLDAATVSSNKAVNTLLSKLTQRFELAEEAVEEAVSLLKSKGFHAPHTKHVIQYLPTDDATVTLLLMQVVLVHKQIASGYQMKSNLHGQCSNIGSLSALVSSSVPGHLQDDTNNEMFGAWGYRDSYFVLNVKPNGAKQVMMKGSRYSISGLPLSNLASFIEKELNVAIDPNGLTFPSCGNLANIPASNLNADAISQIVASFSGDKSRISSRLEDRARRGTGHTQEDMYELRTGLVRFRVPDAVVWPQNVVEIQALVSLAAKNNWCLIPFGGGTNVTHSTRCPKQDIDPRPMVSVDMKLMSRILWVNEEDGLVHVESGITGSELILSMEKLGFTIGHEPDSYEFSTLGGWIATKASGMKQNKYGNIEDIVREVSVVGATGLLAHKHSTNKSSVGRSSTGVDLKSLMIGSEGCLGIIVSAVIKIWPLAETTSHESILLPNFDAGMRYVKDLSKMRAMKPASVRLLDNAQFRLGQALKPDATRYESLRGLVTKKVGYYLGSLSETSVVCATITFEGSANEVKLQKKYVSELASAHGGILAGSRVGKAGYNLTFAIAYLRDFALNYNILGESFETFVPWSKLTQVVEATKHRIYSEHKVRTLPGTPFVCCRITQLYDEGACVYFYFCMQISGVAEPSDTFSDIEKAARQEILDNGGTLSHHHGLGKLRSSFVPQIYSQGYIDSLIAMKKAIDPSNTFGVRNGVFFLANTQGEKRS